MKDVHFKYEFLSFEVLKVNQPYIVTAEYLGCDLSNPVSPSL